MSLRATLLALLCFVSTPALAGEPLLYKDGNVPLEGYFARAENVKGNAPVVVIVHQWKGLGAYEKSRADMLAAEGYNAFAIDMYGQGIRPQTPEDAGKEASLYKNDPALARQRLHAALETVRQMSSVGPEIAIIGYCFGGTMALEAARAGEDLAAAISFHGGLATKAPAAENVIKPMLLVHHGADDPFVTPAEVVGFEQEMQDAHARLTFYAYPGAVHSFTEKEAGNDPTKGAAYNEDADVLSWQRSLSFLEKAFKKAGNEGISTPIGTAIPLSSPPPKKDAPESLTKAP